MAAQPKLPGQFDGGPGTLANARDRMASSEKSRPQAKSRGARMGRRLGVVAFAIPVVGATAIWTSQVLRQVFWPEPGVSPASCNEGVVGLDHAVRRARLEAAGEIHGERAALARFRAALEPEWVSREAVGRSCAGTPAAQRALSELDALRYAEEHAVRYEAVALANQRRRADATRQKIMTERP